MANSKRNFIAGKMNKSLDERLVPNGQYIDAMNVRLGSTEDSEIGSVENSKGNTLLTNITLGVYNSVSYNLSANSVCIGAFEDGANETIYWFIHDKSATDTAIGKADLIVSFNTRTSTTTTHVVSFRRGSTSNTTLNFNERYLINNIDKVGDLLFFTDNYNPPRNINVTKDYAYPLSITGSDNFTYNDLLVIVKPPTQAPTIQTATTSSTDSFMEDKFLCFAYRYKYEDREYSAISQFTNPVFIPNNFSISNGLNDGMTNSINSAIISFNTGDAQVKGVDILFKESSSNVIKVIETLDKSELNYADNIVQSYTFSNKKIFTILSSGEILRLYDNVPLLAKSQTLMGNRLMYGNYYEGYDVESSIDYYTEIDSRTINNTPLTSTVSNFTYTVSGSNILSLGTVTSDFTNVANLLKVGSIFSISFTVSHSFFDGTGAEPPETTGSFDIGFTYTLPQSFNSPADLINSNDFQERFTQNSGLTDWCNGSSFTDIFNCRIPASLGNSTGTNTWDKNNSGTTIPGEGFLVQAQANNVLITVPAVSFSDTIDTQWEFFTVSNTQVNFLESGNPTSLHSNRGYEVGIVYMDEFNRATSVLTSNNNNNHIPCSASDTQNKLKVTIPTTQRAPSWAKRYKFVIKPDSDNYETIYSSLYYTDPKDNHTYFLLEGESIAKVEDGDTFIVKSDSNGPLENCSSAVVLEKKSQAQGFIEPLDSDDNVIVVPAGVYMKILANNFNAVTTEDAFVLPGTKEVRTQNSDRVFMSYNGFQKSIDSLGVHTNYTIPRGSRITIDFNLFRNKASDSGLLGIGGDCDKRSYKLKSEFISSDDYSNIIDWWNNDNIGDIIDSGSKNPSSIVNEYKSVTATTSTQVSTFRELAGSGSTTKYFYQWYKDATSDEIRFLILGTKACATSSTFGGSANIHAEFRIVRSDAVIVFETEPSDALPDVWYEGQDSYPISTDGDGYHLDGGNFANPLDQDQTNSQPAILFLNFFNCFSFGNGVESYKINDSITGDSFNLGNRVTSVAEQEYKETHRSSDITYSGLYNQETNVNRLNEFNLGLLNFKPLEASFGEINKIDGRKTDVLVLQEDKISYVLSGKNLLSDASGGNVLTSVPEVLGEQIARIEDFGISNNPESFASYGVDKFFTDSKRGALLQLKGSSASNEQLTVISEFGMRSWFRDLFTDSFKTQKLGGYDPYMNEYVLSSNDTALPSEDVCSPCGTSRTIDFSADAIGSTQTFCVKLPTTTGDTVINYEIPSGSTIDISVNYGGTITNFTGLTLIGSVTYQKPKTSPNTASITITNVSGSGVSTITPECPTGVAIILKTVVLTNNEDVGKFLHIGHSFNDGVNNVSSPDTQIEFIENTIGASIFASVFTEQEGFQGDNIFPSFGSNVKLRTNKWLPVDNYDVDAQDTFKFLYTSVNYDNNSYDLFGLLNNANSLTKTGSNPTFTSQQFYYVGDAANQYLYLIYDFRTSTPQTLCVQAGVESAANLDVVCCDCECTASTTEYEVVNTTTTTITVTTSAGTFSLIGGQTLTGLCSTSYPVVSPNIRGIIINVTGCNC